MNGKTILKIQIITLVIFAMTMTLELKMMQRECFHGKIIEPSTNYGPFVIDGNGALMTFHEKTGSGSEIDPYVIENLTIVQTWNAPAIHIKNTTLYLVIRNCTISCIPLSSYSSESAGITIERCTNVTVEDCFISSIPCGIYVKIYSQNIRIINNTCQDIWLRGIQLFLSTNVTLEQNLVSLGVYNPAICLGWNNADVCLKRNNITSSGIQLYLSGTSIANFSSFSIDSTNLVAGNPVYFYNNQTRLVAGNFTSAGQAILLNCNDSVINGLQVPAGSAGFSLFRSKNMTFTNNTFTNVLRGLYIGETSSNITFYNNTIQGDCWTGLSLEYTASVNITGNNIYGCQQYGIYANMASSLHVSNNNFSNSFMYGIYIYRADNSTITNNHLFGCGMYLDDSDETRVLKNHLFNCSFGGIKARYSEGFVISNNTISGVLVGDAIMVATCNDTNVLRNVCMNSSDNGISVQGFSSNVSVVSNNCTSNDLSGIHLSGRTWTPGVVAITVTNNSCTFNGVGCYLDYANFTLVKDNNFTDNMYGISMTSARQNSILNNQMLRNGENGIFICWKSTNNVIAYNKIANSGQEGIDVSQSPLNNISWNIISVNHGGCSISISDSTVLAHNTISGSTDFGINIILSDASILFDNNITFNTKAGINLDRANLGNISSNSITHNANGIYISNANGNTITGNIFSGNTLSCIYITRPPSENFIYDNILDDGCIITEGENPGLSTPDLVIIMVLILVGLMVILFSAMRGGKTPRLKVSRVPRISGGVVNEVVYRRPDTTTPTGSACPSCGKVVPNNLSEKSTCPYCGKPIDI